MRSPAVEAALRSAGERARLRARTEAWTARPTHLRLGTIGQAGGTWTACKLVGPEHRPIKTTRVEAETTCQRCQAWIRRNPAAPS